MISNRQVVRTPSRGDIALAAAMAGYAFYDVVVAKSWPGPVGVNAVIVTGMTAALAFRRVAPTVVLAAVGASIVLLGWRYGSAQAWSSVFPFVVATYSAALYARRPWVAAAIVGATVVLRDWFDPYVHSLGDATFTSTLALLTVMAGLEGRRLQMRAVRVEHREETLLREEEELAAAAALDERRRIARELHDILSHGLGVMVLQAGAAEQIVDTDPAAAKGVLESIRSTGIDAIGELGALLSLLREGIDPSLEPQPTLADVHGLVDRARAGGMDVELEHDIGDVRLSKALELSVFRIVQEGLTNASKYAPSAHVKVRVVSDDDRLDVSIVDDGQSAPPQRGGRRGLAGMGERVAVFGGRLRVGPRSSGGWAVEASLPVSR